MIVGTPFGTVGVARRDVVDIAARASFPASDPPAWTPVTGAGRGRYAGEPAAADGPLPAAPGDDDARARPRSVLHPTDYSDTSRAAFEVACDLAGASGVVTVLHVADPPYVPLGMVAPPPLPSGYRGAWEYQLRTVRPADPAVGVAHRLAEGRPAGEIVRAARGAPWDLVVMGARRRGQLRRALTGGVSPAVVRGAGGAVATLTLPDGWPAGLAPGGVLFATDHPDPDADAFALARRVARARGGDLTVLYVPPALRPRRARAAEAEWHRRAAAVPGCRVLVRPGATTEEVLGAASALRTGLVVMPAWGRSRVRDLFDPAAAVRERAPCPVLTVYPPVRRGRPEDDPRPARRSSPPARRSAERKRGGDCGNQFNGVTSHEEAGHAT